eukprot:s2218_g17.t1
MQQPRKSTQLKITVQDHLFDMQKRMNPFNGDVVDGACQLAGFFLLGIVQLCNVIATYVGVAQPYHTIRLMTAGPAGFDASVCYYLNQNISTWRHFAVSMALVSMPLFLASSGLRMVVKFDRENYDYPDPSGSHPDSGSKILGVIMLIYFSLMAVIVVYVHRLHFKVFDEKYDRAKPSMKQHHEVLDVMSSRHCGAESSRGGEERIMRAIYRVKPVAAGPALVGLAATS